MAVAFDHAKFISVKNQTRRQFLEQTAIAAGLCCPFLMNYSKKKETSKKEQGKDYSQFAYCGLECATCDLYKATQTNSIEEKKRLAKEKELPTCAHCDELPTCDKEFWTKWPQVKEKIETMRQELLDAQKV